MTTQVFPQAGPRPPDNLVGSLIAHKPGGAVRKVIRDDGENGLWISHPAFPAQMYKIPREEYRTDWSFYKYETQIDKSELGGFTFDDSKAFDRNVNLNHRAETTVAEEEKSDMPRELTDRQAMADEILNHKPEDVTFSGTPVAGNEEPADTFEEDRGDEDAAAMAEPAPDLSPEDLDEDDEDDDEEE